MAQTLSEIKALLDAHGLRPRHRFGQNFLHDHNQMRRIVEAAELTPGELVLEVGPGTGALSEWLLDAGVRLVVVEIDRDLEPILRERLEPRGGGRVRIVIADVLAGKREVNQEVMEALRGEDAGAGFGARGPAETDGANQRSAAPRAPRPAPGPAPSPSPRFKLIANLPYHVASPLLANLAVDHPEMSLAVVMVQREVADRLTAAPGSKDFGPLGVIIQAMCHAERIATLPPGCFWPPPQVSSAVVRLRRRERPLTRDPHRLGATLQRLFGKRRKQIGAILGRDAALPAGVEPTMRPEQLSVEQLVALSEALP